MNYLCTKCGVDVTRVRITYNPVCFDCKQERRKLLAKKSNKRIKEKKNMLTFQEEATPEAEVEKEAEASN